MTGDLAWQLLRHGLRPGRVVALVGGQGDADDLAAAIVDAGAQVIRLSTHPTHCAARSGSKRSVPMTAGLRLTPSSSQIGFCPRRSCSAGWD